MAKDGRIAEAKNIYYDILEKYPKNRKALEDIKTLLPKSV